MDLQPSFNLFSIINLLGITQAFFFAFLLFKLRKNGNKAHLFLALFLVAYALVQSSEVLEETKYFLIFPHLSSVFPALAFTLGPFLFLYVQALTTKDFRFKPRYLLHFVPFVVLLLLLTPYFILSNAEKTRLIQFEYLHPDQDRTISYICILQILIYFFFSIKVLLTYARTLKDYFSSTEKMSLKWLASLIFALVAIWGVWLLNTRYSSTFFKYAEATLFTAFIYVLGFKGINQPEIFKKIHEAEAKPEVSLLEEVIPARKYEKSGIAPDKIEDALLRLKRKMELEKVYKNNELTLPELATLIAIPGHHLSQLLNDHLHSNFYDYVNYYRVEEVKEELVNPKKDNLTILALALDAGFNSKASFNKAFKKYTGISPSEYKAQQLNKIA